MGEGGNRGIDERPLTMAMNKGLIILLYFSTWLQSSSIKRNKTKKKKKALKLMYYH